ncbi:MAG: hypothetical protein N3A02_02260 [Rectinema sp.]|nr:hypothetical protein [Rectinema sp.]
MRKRLSLLTVLILISAIGVFAQTAETEFALFKRMISPVMKWGENGVLTVPKATTIGKTNFYAGLVGQEAGVLQGMKLYLTSASLIAGSSEDVELGYTHRQLVWEDFYLTNVSMDTFHLKTRFLDFGKYFLPQGAIGVNAVSLVDNKFENRNDILFNIYLAATSSIPIFTPKLLFSVTAVAETIMARDQLGTYMFSGGADLNIFDFLFAFAEIQGFNPTTPNNEIINLGGKLQIGGLSVGVGMFNIIRQKLVSEDIIENIESSTFDFGNAKWMVSIVYEIRLGKLFAPKKTK